MFNTFIKKFLVIHLHVCFNGGIIYLIHYYFYWIFLDSILQESDAGNPCHDGTEQEAPTGSYTCNQNMSVCLGNNLYVKDT